MVIRCPALIDPVVRRVQKHKRVAEPRILRHVIA